MKYAIQVIFLITILGGNLMAQDKATGTIVIPAGEVDDMFRMPTFDESLKLAEEGDVLSQMFIGFAYQDGSGTTKNIEEAIKWYSRSADQGLDIAMLALGSIYQAGDGIEQDFDLALKWYKKAADLNSPAGLMSLGSAYQEGAIVEKDYKLAYSYLIEAAEQNEFLAQLYLGIMEMEGQGREKDFVKAYMWFELAAAGLDVNQGYDTAIELQKELNSKLTQDQIEQAKKMAYDWAEVHG